MSVLRGLTNTELRAADVKVTLDGEVVAISATSLPLPTGASTAAGITALLDELKLKADLTETQPVSVASLPLPTGASTSALQTSILNELQLKADLTEVQPVSIDQTTSGTTNKVTTQFIDESGTPYGIKHVQNKPRVSSMPYTYDIAEGNIPDHESWSKMGVNSALVASTEADLWSGSGVISYPTAAMGLEFLSSNNTDDVGTTIFNGTSTGGSTTSLIDTGKDFTAGTPVAVGDCIILDKAGTIPEYGWVTGVAATTLTVSGGFSKGGTGASRGYHIIDTSATAGAHAVRIGYLTTGFAEKAEIGILNGTTVVPTVNTDIYRINSFRMIAAGANKKPTGNLSLRNLADTPIYSYITAGYTRARNIAYTVPYGKQLLINGFVVSYGYSTNQTHYCRVYTRATYNDGFITDSIFYPYTDIVVSNSSQEVKLDQPTKFPAGVDIKVSALATYAGTAQITLRGWLETA